MKKRWKLDESKSPRIAVDLNDSTFEEFLGDLMAVNPHDYPGVFDKPTRSDKPKVDDSPKEHHA